jgi:menaquinone reductase, molybdopterin-binding-like subunit
MSTARRHFLKFAGGAAAGTLFTPAPWRLIGDTALWTQNWSWIPVPPQGERRVRYTNCALCPAGCGVEARCTGNQPVSSWGVAGPRETRGVLCPAGYCGHHLPWHPGRLKTALRGRSPVSTEHVAQVIARAIDDMRRSGSRESVAVLDLRPGRTASLLYRHYARQFPNGVYIGAPVAEYATTRAAERTAGGVRLGFDLAHAKTILSLGTPLFDGWGTPARTLRADRPFRVMQAEACLSRTAMLADEWLPVKPGSEAALSAGIGHVLLARKLFPNTAARCIDFERYASLAAEYTPSRTAELTGLTPDQVERTAVYLAQNGPAVVLADRSAGMGLPEAVECFAAALNVLLGSIGQGGGFLAMRDTPAPGDWSDGAPESGLAGVPDRSVRILLIDEAAAYTAVDWKAVERKLAPGALVVSLASSPAGLARHAEYVVPASVYPETFDDTPPQPDAAVASFAVSVPLMTPPEGVVHAVEFIGRLAGDQTPFEERLKQRAAGIHGAARGTVFQYADRRESPVSEFKSDGDLWKALASGGRWCDSASTVSASPVRLLAPRGADTAPNPVASGGDDFPLLLIPSVWRGAAVSPLMAKLYQESDLRAQPGIAAIHPESAIRNGLEDGARAMLETPDGRCAVRLSVDASVSPGSIQISTGDVARTGLPGACAADGSGSWETSPARLVTT